MGSPRAAGVEFFTHPAQHHPSPSLASELDRLRAVLGAGKAGQQSLVPTWASWPAGASCIFSVCDAPKHFLSSSFLLVVGFPCRLPRPLFSFWFFDICCSEESLHTFEGHSVVR